MNNYFKLIKKAFFNSVFANLYKDEIKEHAEIVEQRLKEKLIAQLQSVNFGVIRDRYEEYTLKSIEKGCEEQKFCDKEVVVSLTTHGKRIYSVHIAIESIMQQTVKPNRIVLWLNENDFSIENVPLFLKSQMSRGLEIRFVKDVRSYTKLIYALQEFPDSCVITIDDDIIYSRDVIERLVNSYVKDPSCVSCICAKQMHFSVSDKKWIPFNECHFPKLDKDLISENLVPEGFSGVLYPPHSLDNEVFNSEIFLDIAPSTDDIWFKAMAMKKGVKAKMLQTLRAWRAYIIVNPDVQDSGLCVRNYEENKNNISFVKVFDMYNLWDRMDCGITS